ncbi:MAG TPA: zinc ABC transporter substrate-binding protein [Candidatus Dormibacteraeota bacterium]|nr:zinc ABC transporter substrate-binding protein [Candidatus Dormibacteraeota bacterium]
MTAAGLGLIALVSACGATSGHPASNTIAVVAAENEYGSVAAQIGGKDVTVTSIESNPNTDPHTYEVSPSVAEEVGAALVVIQNGVGYDGYMTRILSASPNQSRKVVNVQHLLGLPDSTPNPHLWYDPTTMPKVADALAADYAALKPADATYFTANATRFIASLNPWLEALASFKSQYAGTPVATTEPVADYMLQAAGADNLTPFRFQADVMNGVDPAPQDVSLETSLFTEHKVKVLVYNQQVTDTLTQTFISAAQSAKIPVIGVYETMPAPGYNYESWMLAEVAALQKAVADGISTQHL